MTSSYFADFDDDDELEFEGSSDSREYDEYMTVRGLLSTHFGKEHGDEIYELLLRTAQKTADNIHSTPTEPGILFTDEGGEFVGFEKDALQEDEGY
jgi:hypothetical protein